MQNNSDALVKDFYAHKHPTSYRKGEVLLLPDPTHLPPIAYIEKGIVEQYTITDGGEKVVVNLFKSGAFFPASSAVNQTHNTYYFEAVVDVTIRQAPAEEIETLLLTNPVIVYDLLKRLYRGVDGMLEKFASSLSLSAQQRVMNELVIYGKRFGVLQGDGSVILSMTAEQIASRTGLARETVSREMKKLQREGVLSVNRGKIILLDAKMDA
jgi:CRP-like cAMP-binding protein